MTHGVFHYDLLHGEVACACSASLPERRIFDRQPRYWRDLERMIALAFCEMNCEATLHKRIRTVRGKVTVDVYVTDVSATPRQTFICECKFWSKNVSRSAVDSFCNVVAGAGANTGLLISKRGFQRSAVDAAKRSNVLLLTFDEFQDLFYDRWVTGMCRRTVTRAHSLEQLIWAVFKKLAAKSSRPRLLYNLWRQQQAYWFYFVALARSLEHGNLSHTILCVPKPEDMVNGYTRRGSFRLIVFHSPRQYFAYTNRRLRRALNVWRGVAAKRRVKGFDRFKRAS